MKSTVSTLALAALIVVGSPANAKKPKKDATPTQPAMLSIADRNLYVAKHGGRDQVVSGAARDGRTRSYRDGAAAVRT